MKKICVFRMDGKIVAEVKSHKKSYLILMEGDKNTVSVAKAGDGDKICVFEVKAVVFEGRRELILIQENNWVFINDILENSITIQDQGRQKDLRFGEKTWIFLNLEKIAEAIKKFWEIWPISM